MGNLGGGEILVILLVALIFLGPEKLPEVARQVGKVMGEVRKVSAGFQREMHDAMRTIDETAKLEPAPASATIAGEEIPAASATENVGTTAQVETSAHTVTDAVTDDDAAVTVTDAVTDDAARTDPPHAAMIAAPIFTPGAEAPPLPSDLPHGGDR